MRILHISPSYKPAFIYGGPTVSVSRLCEELAKAGSRVEVFTTTANGSGELPLRPGEKVMVDGVSVTYFKRLTGDHTHFSPALLYALWKKGEGFDAIHIHAWWNLVSVLAVLVCVLRGLRPILSPRGMLSAYSFAHENSLKKKMIHQTLGKFLLPRALLHATTALEVRDSQEVVPGWPHFVLPNIVKLPEQPLIEKRDENKEVLQLIFLSRLDRKKGLELLFEALSKADFIFQLHIYGNQQDTYEKELKALAYQLKLCPHIRWHGWVEGDAKFEKLAAADLFVLTSYNENFANVVIESLAVGTPVLLSDQVGLADYVAERQFGWISKPDISYILNSLKTAYITLKVRTPPALLVDTAQVKQDFDGQTVAAQYLHAYQNLL